MDNEFRKMLKKVKLDDIIAYLLYETEAEEKRAETYEKKVEGSYNDIFDCIEGLYPSANRNDDKLWDAVLDFATLHDDVYFEMGIIIGFQLYKNMEHGLIRLKGDNTEILLADRKTHRDNDFLKELFEQRMETALEENLRVDKEYKRIRGIANSKQDRLNKIGLNKNQWQLVDRAISSANALGSEYGRVAYRQGFQDGIKLVSELYSML